MRTPVAIDDGSLGAWLKMEATPFHVVIDRDGRIAYAGHQDGPRLDEAIERVLRGRAARAPIEAASLNPERLRTLQRFNSCIGRFSPWRCLETHIGFQNHCAEINCPKPRSSNVTQRYTGLAHRTAVRLARSLVACIKWVSLLRHEYVGLASDYR